jgi:hypothetical protein
MDDIESDEQWNAEPGLLDRQALHLANRGRAGQIEQIPDGPRTDGLGGVAGDGRTRHRGAGRRHGELTQLFGERHLANQPVDVVRGYLGHSRAPDTGAWPALCRVFRQVLRTLDAARRIGLIDNTG